MIRPFALSAAVGKRVRELRIDSGVSVAQLARQAGLATNDLLAIEAGTGRPSVATLAAVAKPLRVSLLELVQTAAKPKAVPRSAPSDLDAIERVAQAITDLPESLGDKLDAVEEATVKHALTRTGGNQSAAARLLGMERKALTRRLQRARLEAKTRAAS